MLDAQQLYSRWRDVVPNLETVTLKARQAGASQGSFDSYTLTAHQEPLTTQDMQLLGITVSEDYQWWEIWQEWIDTATALSPAELPCPAPKESDVIVGEDGAGWVIQKTIRKLMGNVFKCLCLRKLG